MQTAQQERIYFVEDEVTCPLCESYSIEERETKFVCHSCGTSWKTLSPER